MKWKNTTYGLIISIIVAVVSMGTSCEKEEPILKPPGTDKDTTDTITPIDTNEYVSDIDFSKLTDTYWDTHWADDYPDWGMHNVHDPVIRKFGDFFYSYSTDVGYGIPVRLGLQIRKSTNLVEWEYLGWVFDNLPPKGAAYIQSIGATPNNSLWAPSVVEVDGTYRLYYSLASNIGLKSCIGLATSDDPFTGWQEVDVVVGTNNTGTQTNGIDPSVIITPEGEHWMMYGSSWDGIYIVELDPGTGLAKKAGDRGRRIAHRGFTGGTINGNIEAAEVMYNPDQNMYYLFIGYDWLSTKYNVRVGRSPSVDGPYYDMLEQNLYDKTDNRPMIIAPYKFKGHSGWQGVGHCTVFDNNGKWFIAHQARPGADFYYMDMHVREIFWSEDGWPIVSPERYATHPEYQLKPEDIAGEWEIIRFGYKIVPGFDAEQTSPDFQTSESLYLNSNWTVNDSETDKWFYTKPWLRMNIDGIGYNVHVSVGRDWENGIDSTLLFTGNKSDGLPIWGKKIIK